jgi:hypothetical protein
MKGDYYEEYVKSKLYGTPLFPINSSEFNCEWIRLHVKGQSEAECGARACLHAHTMAAIVQANPMSLPYMNDLRGALQEVFDHKVTRLAMKKARIWARQSLATKRLVTFREIDNDYLQLDWNGVKRARKRESDKIRKRQQRESKTRVNAKRKASLSPEELEASKASSRASTAKSRAKKRKASLSPEELEALRISNRASTVKSKAKRKASLSNEDRNIAKERNATFARRSREKRMATLPPLEVEDNNMNVRERVRSQESNLNVPVPTIESCLETISNGDRPTVNLDEHPEMRKLQTDFLKKCESKKMKWCLSCKERWWDLKVDDSGVCSKCKKQKADPKFGIALMSKDNNMDPFPNGYRSNLPELNQIEQAMISRVQVIMKCYRLKDGGFGYRGHVMNFEQDLNKIFQVLPVDFKDLPIVILRKRDDKHPNKYRDFRVRRWAVQIWLEFLKKHSPAYQDVTVDTGRLLSLPLDGCVADRVLTQIEEEVEDPLPSDEPTLLNESHDDDDADDLDREEFMGPEQGGAAGDADHPTVVEHFLFTPPNKPPGNIQLAPEESNIRNLLEKACKEATSGDEIIVHMPEPGDPVSDYYTPYIQAMAFPCLFRFGLGDVTGKDREHDVSMTDTNKHLLKYCVSIDGAYKYPFSEHITWMHWAQNTAERHRHNSQKSVYLNKNPEDDNLTEEELIAMVNERGPKLEKLIGRMQIFNANICGSNAYFNKKRRELNALIEQEGMCTLWFTFSAADNHWKDLFRLILGDSESFRYHNKNEKEKAALRRQLRRQSPHIVDA